MKTAIITLVLLAPLLAAPHSAAADNDGGHSATQAGTSAGNKTLPSPPSGGNRRWYYCWTDAKGGWHIDPQPPTDTDVADLELVQGATQRQIDYAGYMGIVQASRIHQAYSIQQYNREINRIEEDNNRIIREVDASLTEIKERKIDWLKSRKDYYERDCINNYAGPLGNLHREICEQGGRRMERYLRQEGR